MKPPEIEPGMCLNLIYSKDGSSNKQRSWSII